MTHRTRTVVASDVQIVLNYFGRCPICDHPAHARHITARFDDGGVESRTIAECGGWCGWKGPVDPTPMTGDTAVLTRGRNTIASATSQPDARPGGSRRTVALPPG
ncbi:hypothetical protein [Nocardia sp. SSK8]|uniref:hypothetical protein n=1 Tax=Nocardia sp. SSK8 TaxID=3120154 RepID=UPI00300A24A0